MLMLLLLLMMMMMMMMMMRRSRMTRIMIMMLLDEDLRLHADAQLEGWMAHPGVADLSKFQQN